MKRIFKLSIVALVLICTVAQVSDAKTRRHHNSSSSSSTIPSFNAIWNANGSRGLKALGIKKLYAKSISTCTIEYYGKNVKVTPSGDGWQVKLTATGSNAFYYFTNWAEGDGIYDEFGFKDRADRDNFYNQIMNSDLDFDEYEVKTDYSSGWYTVSLENEY